MTHRYPSLVLLLALAQPFGWALADEPAPAKAAIVEKANGEQPRGDSLLKLPASVHGLANTFVQVNAETNCKTVRWVPLDAGIQIVPPEMLKDSRSIIVLGPSGSYRILAYTALGDQPSEPSITVVILGASPTPAPVPVPPGPEPTPAPPPGPGPAPIPVPVAGFRVIFVHETIANTSREHLNIIYSPKVAEYLDRKTVKSAKGKPEWKIWDKDIDVSMAPEMWRNLWTATKPQLGKLPAVVIVNDAKGLVFELPNTEQATLDLLKRHGGE